jgi:NTE family protein
MPDYFGSSQRGRVRMVYDTQDRAMVPQFGLRVMSEAAYLYGTPGSPSAPQLSTQVSFAHQIGKKNVFVMGLDGGTMLNRNVAQPFRYTLGGPYRLSASAIGEYRGTDYFLLQPTLLRRVAELPAVLGQSVYVGGIYEAGQMRAPGAATIMRQDFSFGLVAETPLGVITLAPAIGDGDRWKLVFTLGKVF